MAAKQVGKVVIESEKGDSVYSFVMPIGAPLGECYDAAFEVLGEIIAMSKDAYERNKRNEKEEKEEADK